MPAPVSPRLQTNETLRIGDVARVAVELTDKTTGAPWWWHTFRVVYRRPERSFASGYHLTVLMLRLHPNMNKDLREIDMCKDVVMKLEPAHWPQGVSAMWFKLLHTGVIELDED